MKKRNKIGRPMKLNDERVKKLRKQGKTMEEIALIFSVTRSAVFYSLKRNSK